MKDYKDLDLFFDMVNDNSKKAKDNNISNETEIDENEIKYTKKLFKRKGKIALILLIVAAIGIGTGILVKKSNDKKTYDGSKYFGNDKSISQAVSNPKTTTIDALKEMEYDLSNRDEKYLNEVEIHNYLNALHNPTVENREDLLNLRGDVINISLDYVKDFIKEECGLSEDTKININYDKKSNLNKDELTITYENKEETGNIVVDKELKYVIASIVEAEKVEREHPTEINSYAFEKVIKSGIELDDVKTDSKRAVKALI